MRWLPFGTRRIPVKQSAIREGDAASRRLMLDKPKFRAKTNLCSIDAFSSPRILRQNRAEFCPIVGPADLAGSSRVAPSPSLLENLSQFALSIGTGDASRAYWDSLSPEERSWIMKARPRKRKKR
jgi:hypothetical protein